MGGVSIKPILHEVVEDADDAAMQRLVVAAHAEELACRMADRPRKHHT